MPRLIIRKSALSTTHYCRRWGIPGNSARPQRRKANDECSSICSTTSNNVVPSGTGGRTPTEEDGRGKGRGVVVGVAGGGVGKGLIGAGVRVVLNICCWLRRSRCALLLFLVLFFTLSFFKLTSHDYDSDLEMPYPGSDFEEESPGLVAHHLPRAPVINAGNYRLARPNCNALEDGDESEIRLVEDMLYTETRVGIPNSYFEASTINCSKFRELRNYADMAYSVHELQTPLAYAIAVKGSAEQVERLLRAIYTPQNVYCLYNITPVDVDFLYSDLGKAVKLIAGCFGNVFVTSDYDRDRKEDEPPVAPYRVCLESLLSYPSWRYLLLTAEGDFPLKTNRDIVDSVKHAVTIWRSKRTNGQRQVLPPLNAGNDFSGFLLTRKMALFAMRSLEKPQNGNTNAVKMSRPLPPGDSPEFLDLKIRLDNFCPGVKPCALTASDLHWLVDQPVLFARKFDLATDYVIIACLEKRIQIFNSQNQEVKPAELT